MLIKFLQQMLLTSPDKFTTYLEREDINIQNEELSKKQLDAITYKPFNHRLLSDIKQALRLGQTLYSCIKMAVKDEDFEKLKSRLNSIEQHKEAEEGIINTLFQFDTSLQPQDSTVSEKSELPEKAENYKKLFIQCGEDLSALLKLNIDIISKPRLLIYLERLINLYILLYYLRVICKKDDNKDSDSPLILPVCSNESDDEFKLIGDNCLQIYRHKAVQFWREYVRERVAINADILKCSKKKPQKILEEFLKHHQIFKTGPKRLNKIEDDIPKNLKQLTYAKSDPVDQFTEAFLSYNLKGNRTLARLRIFDWQGPGAGIVAPERGTVKHFHLMPELLETLVIIFVSQNRHQSLQLSLQNFIINVRERYGIILGHSEYLEPALGKQSLPIPSRSLLDRNLMHVISMLRHLNMLESLSDTAMFIKCPFQFQEKV
ncbi:MAG: hypothetical protein GY795_49800 [Desulfobacterales bacterium]|nr:hypothetical protein [Desulfobacterales bacterium]